MYAIRSYYAATPPADDGLLEVAKILDAVCRQKNCRWGALDSALLAVFLPDKSGAQTIELIHRIQKNIKEKTYHTITVGIADYPAITFQKSEILQNAVKALDHATFFGPDSAVCFDSISLNISRITSYNVCYTKLLRNAEAYSQTVVHVHI